MYSDQEKQKKPCEQAQKPQPLTDEEAKQANGGASVPGASSSQPGNGVYVSTSSFVMGGGVIKEEEQESGGVSVPNTSSFRMDGGTH